MSTVAASAKSIGTSVTMETTGLTALAGSSTSVGWQSQVIDDTSIKAMDYQVTVGLAMGASAPAGDKALYCYVIPWYYNDASWFAPSTGTTANLSKSTTGGAVTIGAVGHNLGSPKVITYGAASEVVRTQFNVGLFAGDPIPDGWQLVLINVSTATVIASTSTFLGYKPIAYTSTTP